MKITTKITVHMGNNLRKSYSKYESPARMFATARPDLVAGRRGGRKKKKKKKRKKKSRKKNPRPNTLGIRPTDGMPNYKQYQQIGKFNYKQYQPVGVFNYK